MGGTQPQAPRKVEAGNKTNPGTDLAKVKLLDYLGAKSGEFRA
jgi:hypothetical protein